MGLRKGQVNNPKGRPKGSVNKATKALKDMILGALEDSGGQEYFALQARENPTAFMALVGKVLPKEMELTGKDGTPLMPTEITLRFVDAKSS